MSRTRAKKLDNKRLSHPLVSQITGLDNQKEVRLCHIVSAEKKKKHFYRPDDKHSVCHMKMYTKCISSYSSAHFVSKLGSPDWPGSQELEMDLEFTEICRLLPSKCWDFVHFSPDFDNKCTKSLKS